MGIDIYTTTLTSHLRNLDAATGAALRRESHPLTLEGLQASMEGFVPSGRRLGVMGAYLTARAVRRSWASGVPSAGSPFADLGPIFLMNPDRIDARAWLRLKVVLSECRSGRPRDDGHKLFDHGERWLRDNFFDSEWDDFDGVSFARAVEVAQAIIVPSGVPVALTAGGVAVASTVDGRRFLDRAVATLGFGLEVLEDDYDPDMSEADDFLLYNLRVLHHYVEQTSTSAQPAGIWG